MKTGSLTRRLASALLLCAVAASALADGDAAGGSTAAPPAPARRRPPPTVLVLPLGFGVLLPLTLPTATPRARTVPIQEARDAPAAVTPDDGPTPARSEAR